MRSDESKNSLTQGWHSDTLSALCSLSTTCLKSLIKHWEARVGSSFLAFSPHLCLSTAKTAQQSKTQPRLSGKQDRGTKPSMIPGFLVVYQNPVTLPIPNMCHLWGSASRHYCSLFTGQNRDDPGFPVNLHQLL